VKQSVRDAFMDFTVPLEGKVPWMYLDVKGLVTTGVGNLIDPVAYAVNLPWVRRSDMATRAPRQEIVDEFNLIKSSAWLAKAGYRPAEKLCLLRLTDDGVRELVMRKFQQNYEHLKGRFPAIDEWPADAQLATMSMAWACGPAFRFQMLEAYLRSSNFSGAAQECHINESGNPGLKPRNAANKRLYANAAYVVKAGMDLERLYWPKLAEEANADESNDTGGDEATRVASPPESQPIIHDFNSYFPERNG
jgi:hypothetical protein